MLKKHIATATYTKYIMVTHQKLNRQEIHVQENDIKSKYYTVTN